MEKSLGTYVNLPVMENPKKICFFTHYSSMDGANQSLLTLIKYIKGEVEIKKVFVSANKNQNEGLTKELKKIGIPFETLPFKPYLYFSGTKNFLALPLNFILNIPSWMRMYRQLKNEQIDCIYSNSSIENTGILMAKFLGKKHFWHIREFGYRDYKYSHLGGDYMKRKLLAQSNQLIAISQSIADYIQLPKKTALIPNGIFYKNELATYTGKETLPSIINLGMVGVIGSTKNQKRAIELLKELLESTPLKLHLNFYGGVAEEPYLKALENTIIEYEMKEHVTFHGFINDKNKIYQNIDLLLMCSLNEAFGRVTVEAMAHGIPVVGYDNAGTGELIDDGENGLLYDDSRRTLEDVVKSLIQNRNLYRKISQKAQLSAQRYSVERYGSSILSILREG